MEIKSKRSSQGFSRSEERAWGSSLSRLLRYLLSLIGSRRLLVSASLILFTLFFISLSINFTGSTGSMLLRLVAHPFISLVSLILAVDLMVLSRITQVTSVKEIRLPAGRKTYAVLVTVFLLYAVLVYMEILLAGHTLYAPILLAFSVVFYVILSEAYSIGEGTASTCLPLLLAILITAHYIAFPPSFGNDTWRDIMWSEETLRTGYFTESRITHLAYPVPVVVLLYSMTSLIGGFATVDSSVIVGLLYLFILGVVLITMLRRIHGNAERAVFAVLLLLIYSTPLITLWGVWFIPQSLTLVFMALLLMSINLKHHSWMAQVILAIALVLSHAGVALYTLIYLAFLSIFMGKTGDLRKHLLLISIVYISYVLYTSVQYAVIPGVKSYLDYLLTVPLGREVSQVQAPVEIGVLNRLFPWIPVALALTFGVNTLYANSLKQGKSSEWEVLTVLFSTVTLVVGYALTIINPGSTADRYIGLSAVFLLILSSYSGVKILKARRLSKGLLYGLVALSISSLAFSGTFTPLNPITLNPSSYSVYGLPTHADAEIIHSIVGKIDPSNQLTIYTDWRTGLLYIHDSLREYYVSIHSSLWSITLGNLKLQLFGSYGYKYTGDLSFMHSNSILVLRVTSFTMVESWGKLRPELNYQCFNISKTLDSGGVTIYAS